jgi:hypothetical protein
MSGNFTINSNKEIGAIDNPFEATVAKNVDKETKIFEETREVAKSSDKAFEESSLKKKNKFTIGPIKRFFSYIYKKIFSQKALKNQELGVVEKSNITNEQYVDLLGKIAEKMLKNNLWEEEGCFRVPGNEKNIIEAQKKLYNACNKNVPVQLDTMGCADYASLFKKCFRDFKEHVEGINSTPCSTPVNLSDSSAIALLLSTLADSTGEESVIADIVPILRQNGEAWKNITLLLTGVASSEKTKLNQESLKLAFPFAASVIDAAFTDLAKS